MTTAANVLTWAHKQSSYEDAGEPNRPFTPEELLVSSLAQTDALAKLLIEKADYRRGI